MDRQSMEVDIVCVGFGPAAGGFLTTLARGMEGLESRSMPGMPPQVICYERADDIGVGVSGVVTRGRGIRAAFPDFDPSAIPMAAAVKTEKLIYLLDPIGASRRGAAVKLGDRMVSLLGAQDHAYELPYVPPFLHKLDGFVLSIGQFNQWVGSQLMAGGAVQIWPGMPVAEPLIEDRAVRGVRLADQEALPGMDVRAALTVVADGPVGAVSRRIDERLGMPDNHRRHEWAVGMKFVIELPESSTLEPGTVFHTLGYPEPEIFGFFYVHPERVASVGIFLPSWFESPIRATYRYLQHFIRHPFIWKMIEGGRLRSWGAKSIEESGRTGEPHLVGEGYARIGEGSGSTNVLTGSGVDEAWTTGSLLGEAVLDLMRAGAEFTRENLDRAYVARRRASWLEAESRAAEKARQGFQAGFVQGMIGMALAGFSNGSMHWPTENHRTARGLEAYYAGRISTEEIAALRADCERRGVPLHDALMERAGWPAIEYDGQLLVSHQDALILGGKVQAPPGFADHVRFRDQGTCETCGTRICVEVCSGEAIAMPQETPTPAFDKEKCVHCGACLWNCPEGNVEFLAGAGGLHSTEN